jgi:FMN phosphatase YigB (HAD superfamily)
MIKALISDLSRTLLFPADEKNPLTLNDQYRELMAKNNGFIDFWQYFTFNGELLDAYLALKLPVYIFTSDTIQDDPAMTILLKGKVLEIFSAKRSGLFKDDSYAYEFICKQKIGIKPEEALFIDDNSKFLEAARKAGLLTIKYSDNPAAIKALNSLTKST